MACLRHRLQQLRASTRGGIPDDMDRFVPLALSGDRSPARSPAARALAARVCLGGRQGSSMHRPASRTEEALGQGRRSPPGPDARGTPR